MNPASEDEKYMQAALKLAQRGSGSVEPNPAVGAIIVKANRIIGRGWHKKFGGPHAEINALEDCKNIGADPQGATMYITLEPCCHQGKTPACTEAIINAKHAEVVVATLDPSEHANGKGIERLRNAGIKVEVGVCENEAKLINAPFIKYASTGQCWVILKWAQSIDGKVTSDNQRWISNELSRKDAHKLRRRTQAIVVGINTIVADDPSLTARPSQGQKTVRVVLDNNLRIPLECKLLATAKKTPVLILASRQSLETKQQIVEDITRKGAEVLSFAETQSNLHFLLDELSKRGIAQVLVEGGPKVIASFLRHRLGDECVVYIAPKILGPEGSVAITEEMAELSESVNLQNVDIKHFSDDVRLRGFF